MFKFLSNIYLIRHTYTITIMFTLVGFLSCVFQSVLQKKKPFTVFSYFITLVLMIKPKYYAVIPEQQTSITVSIKACGTFTCEICLGGSMNFQMTMGYMIYVFIYDYCYFAGCISNFEPKITKKKWYQKEKKEIVENVSYKNLWWSLCLVSRDLAATLIYRSTDRSCF